MKYDIVVVGAGLAGAVLAEQLSANSKKSILIVEKRNHIAGNCYDYMDSGILVHKYGPHAFHTNSELVWNYLSLFTEWHHYEHRVTGEINGNLVPIPFNLTSIKKCFDINTANTIIKKLTKRWKNGDKKTIWELKQEKDEHLKLLADFIYNKVFLNYTIKQWGVKPEELSPSVVARIPIYISEDDRYFQDKYQAIPKNGYTAMFKNIIDKPNIEVMLNTDFFDIKQNLIYDKLYYTGMIDEFFDYKMGTLPYRSLEFVLHKIKGGLQYPTAQTNYPNEHEYTRITEFAHFQSPRDITHTILAYEYPQAYNKHNIPYYPIPNKNNEILATKYKELTKKLKNVEFYGRLANYCYYNMDQIVASVLLANERTKM